MRGKVIREWSVGQRRIGVEVLTEHPLGPLPRGWIAPAPSPDWRCAWLMRTYDHDVLDPIVGDYLDAEAALLAATTELDDND